MQREVRGSDLAQVHPHCEGGVEDHETDDMMECQGCNDVGSKENESNQGPFEERKLRVRMLVEMRVENIQSRCKRSPYIG